MTVAMETPVALATDRIEQPSFQAAIGSGGAISRAILVTVMGEARCRRAAARMPRPSFNDPLIVCTRSSGIGFRPDFFEVRRSYGDMISIA